MTFPFPSFVPAVAVVFAATAWDPANKNGNITLSNSNLTATTVSNSGAYENVRAVKSMLNTGAFYWEWKCTSAGSNCAAPGIGNGSFPTAFNTFPGSDVNSWGYFPGGGIWHNNVNTLSVSTFTVNDVISFAFDVVNGRFWVAKNGVWQNGGITPVVGSASGAVASGLVTGTNWFALHSNNLGNSVATANFGSSAFAFPVPPGFTGIHS